MNHTQPKPKLCLIAGLAVSTLAPAQTASAQVTLRNPTPFEVIDDARVRFDRIDIDALRAEAKGNEALGMPQQFAVPVQVATSPLQDGVAETTRDGRVVWRYRIETENARHINLGTRFELPPSALLYMLDERGEPAFRALTAEDNRRSGTLYTPIVRGSVAELYVEVDQDEYQDFVNGFQITSVNLGFKGFGTDVAADAGRDTDDCHIDVACDVADIWQTEINSVGVYTLSGIFNCSGALMNTTARDGQPVFMTAYHCIEGSPFNFDVSNMVVYWNFQNSTCRAIGSPQNAAAGNGPLNQFTFGGTLLMSHDASDWVLVELDSVPNVAFGVTYAGWDRRSFSNTAGVGIHHPDTDEKRISFENQTPITGTFASGPPQGNVSTWDVSWDDGGVEGGSSGSPYFNNDRKVIGTLTAASFPIICNPQNGLYGRLSVAWNGGGTPSTRLSDWLDPLGTGELFVESMPDTVVPPFAPQQTSPADGSTGVALPVTFQWNDAFLADSYILQVIDQDAPAIVYSEPVNNTLITLGSDILDPDTNYAWVVTAVNSAGQTPSDAGFTFSTEPPPPGDFDLLTPALAATDVPIPVNFSWEASAGADEYTVLVLDSDTPAFVTSFTTTDTSFSLDENDMNPGTSYTWRVTASNDVGSLQRDGNFTTEVPGGCDEDLSGDGSVGPDDLFQLLAAFGQTADGDVDGDGITGPDDLFQLLAAFGTSC